MCRRLSIACLLFALLCQALAVAGPAGSLARGQDAGHAALHWLEESHHHHDDGTWHLDDSDESAWHLVADHGYLAAAMLPDVSLPLPSLVAVAPRVHEVRASSPPFLAGPLRPPRLTA
jgi:hypothetical protein